MSEKKDSDNEKSNDSFEMPDMESTVRLDFSGNVISTASENSPASDDFDQTIDGLMDIEELLKNEDPLSESSEEVSTASFTTDDIDLDELDAGINSLSDDLSDSPAKEDRLDSLDEPFELDEPASTPEDSFTDVKSDENEFLFLDSTDGTTDEATDALNSFPDDKTSEEVSDSDEAIDGSTPDETTSDTKTDDFDLNEPDLSGPDELTQSETDSDQATDNEQPPVIELTEEMLDEPAGEASDEPDEEDIQNDEISETPELTTTETHVLADATAAIKEIHEEDSQHPQQGGNMPEHDTALETDPDFPTQFPSEFAPTDGPETSSSSNTLPVILAILGIAAGGFGAWMAFDASSKISEMQSQIRELQAAKASSADKRGLADLQQRLTKVERRLTGTPTVEAASPLGSSGPVAEDASLKEKAEKPKIKVITPQTPIASTRKSTKAPAKPSSAATTASGPWVVNLSSHNKESAALKEAKRLKSLGLNSEVHNATIKGKIWYRVQIVGYNSKAAAKAALRDVQQRSGIKGAWIGKR